MKLSGLDFFFLAPGSGYLEHCLGGRMDSEVQIVNNSAEKGRYSPFPPLL